MAKDMYAVLGTSADYSLLAGTGTESEIGVALAPGNGALERGTIIKKGANGLYAPATTGGMAGGECAVLMNDEYTGAEKNGIAPSAAAYKTGRFLSGKVKLATGSLSAADVLELRRQGITIDGMSGTLNNEVVPG